MVLKEQKLTDLLDEVEISLTDLPTEYHVVLPELSRKDDKILGEFYKQERDARPHCVRNKQWSKLYASEEKLKSPRKHMKKFMGSLPKLKEKLRTMNVNAQYIFQSNTLQETQETFGDYYSCLHRMFNLEIKKSEAILTYTKELADEKGVKPIQLVKSEENRNEVLRRALPKQELFAYSSKLDYEMNSFMGAVSGEVLDYFARMKSDTRRVPIIKTIASLVCRSVEKKIPSEEVVKTFMSDELRYVQKREKDIYQNKKFTEKN